MLKRSTGLFEGRDDMLGTLYGVRRCSSQRSSEPKLASWGIFRQSQGKEHPLSQAFNTDPSLGMHQKNDLRLPGLHAVGNRNLGVLVTWVHIYKENLPKIVR